MSPSGGATNPLFPVTAIRRGSLAALCFLALAVLAGAQEKAALPALVWHELPPDRVEGKGWRDTQSPYDRLPAKAEGVVRPPVWDFGKDSTGLYFRFITDAESIYARWTLRRPNRLAMPHMPATGVSGLDLYYRDGDDRWRWLAVGRPDRPNLNEKPLVRGLDPGRREYLLYLPLYNGVGSIEIGVPPGTHFELAPPRYSDRKPVVFYGSSRLQGGCASRPGMAYPAIVARALDWPVLNLGFSGNAKTEPEMAALLAELDPAAYVLDSLPNLTSAQARERVEPFVRTLRARHPTTPIVLVELVDYSDASLVALRRNKANESNAHLRALYARLQAAGDRHLYYVSAAPVVARGNEGTVDGAHPTDLGFYWMAEAVGPVVREALHGAGAGTDSKAGH